MANSVRKTASVVHKDRLHFHIILFARDKIFETYSNQIKRISTATQYQQNSCTAAGHAHTAKPWRHQRATNKCT